MSSRKSGLRHRISSIHARDGEEGLYGVSRNPTLAFSVGSGLKNQVGGGDLTGGNLRVGVGLQSSIDQSRSMDIVRHPCLAVELTNSIGFSTHGGIIRFNHQGDHCFVGKLSVEGILGRFEHIKDGTARSSKSEMRTGSSSPCTSHQQESRHGHGNTPASERRRTTPSGSGGEWRRGRIMSVDGSITSASSGIFRRHFDSLPNSYSQAGFDTKDILQHIRLVEQAAGEDLSAMQIQQISGEDASGSGRSIFKLTFACNSSFLWATMSSAIDGSVLSCKKIQIFEKKGLTLGVVTVVVQHGGEKQFKSRIDAALRSAARKQRSVGSVKLPFSLCGCQEEGLRAADADSQIGGDDCSAAASVPLENMSLRRIHLPTPLPESSLVVSIDEWQTICSGSDELGRWLVSVNKTEFVERGGSNSFKGSYRGKKVWIKMLKGCDKGSHHSPSPPGRQRISHSPLPISLIRDLSGVA